MRPGVPGQTSRGPIFGTPGSGKTTFMKAFDRVAKEMKIRTLFIKMKDCTDEVDEIEIPNLEAKTVERISSILHFTASNSLKPSFDLLETSECDNIDCLISFAEKKYKNDVAMWVTARLIALKKSFIRGNKLIIYKCLEGRGELVKRLSIGLIYAFRSHINRLLMMDDAIAIVLNSLYGDVWPLMVRPYLASLNYWPEVRDLLRFEPVIIAPGDDYGGLYKLTSDKYIVMYKRQKWELSPDEIYSLAKS